MNLMNLSSRPGYHQHSSSRQSGLPGKGNAIGSNIANVDLLWRDFAVMFILTLLLVLFAFQSGDNASISRFKGAIPGLVWISYLVLLYLTSVQGDPEQVCANSAGAVSAG